MLQVVNDEVHCNPVLFSFDLGSAPRHDDVRILHRWLHELREGRLHKAMVGLENTVHCATTLDNVSLEATRQSNIVICVNENFQITASVQFLVVEAKNSLYDDQGRPFTEQTRLVTLAC